MANHYRGGDRGQEWLLPPSVADWLPKGHLAWFILDTLDSLDLTELYARYPLGRCGNAAYDPKMVLGVLIYAYCIGLTSSRRIERACETDLAFRVLAVNEVIDHQTICRFRRDNAALMKSLFLGTLRLAKEAGLLRAGTVALDGTKMKANASLAANRTREGLDKERKALEEEVERRMAEAEQTDAEEDARFGADRRGDEMPAHLADRERRLAVLAECKRRLEEVEAERRAEQQAKIDRREEEERESGKRKRGRKPKSPDKAAEETAEAKANTTDPDSGIMKTRQGFVQGYNAQAVVTMDQIIVAADVTNEANDQNQLVPMTLAAKANIAAIDETQEIKISLDDAGYCSEKNLTAPELEGIELFVATRNERKASREDRGRPAPRGRIPRSATVRQRMDRKMRTKRGRAIYRMRSMTVEPVFGQIKEGMGIDGFARRGIDACRGEWSLISACHNLLKLWRRKRSGAPGDLRNPAKSSAETSRRGGNSTLARFLDPSQAIFSSFGRSLAQFLGVSTTATAR